ncbi:MAG: HAMP domain-containing protein [Treponema sp.]|jgi:adenylate cyclase|nr:HAMP domain-containing protein [Treponema sp.]
MSQGKSPNTASGRVRYPIGFKLMTIVTVLLLLSLGTITALVSYMVTRDVQVTAEDTNFTVNAQAAITAETILQGTLSNTRVLLDAINVAPSEAVMKQVQESFFAENKSLAAIILADADKIPSPNDRDFLLNTTFIIANEMESALIPVYLASQTQAINRALAGETLLLNGAPEFELPLLVLLAPWNNKTAIVLFSSNTLAQSFGTGANVSYLINVAGDLLIHPDQTLIRQGANIGELQFIRDMQELQRGEARQTMYTDDRGVRYFGALTKLALANLSVITSVEYNVIVEGIAATTRRNLFLSGGVLFLSVLLIWFFSKSISVPVKRLAAAAELIKEGQFEIELKAATHDEVGLLTESFVEMGRGLAERERLKDTFGRFINKEIAEKAMRGELGLGGETKQVTVFFSDIRDFTAISEKLEPFEVVSFLNDYMTRMVACVNDTGGVVDKFIGDSVMAVWGAPVSAGDIAQDALACVRASLMMRESLKDFNRDRGGIRKPVIRIGCGINTGYVVAGQIGSNERMEYTVIGDAVNLASRAEALNKPLGTDILITEETWHLVKDRLIVEEMPSVTVKGKEKPVRMFAVVNIKDGESGPKSLKEVRQDLGIPEPDLSKVNLGEEKKYKIGNE